MVYKWCIVSQCKNTSIKNPEKVFISMPSNATLRKKWLKLARVPKDVSPSSCSFYCEDHFNIEKDISNYMQYKMGFSPKIRMVNGALPSKFDCQLQNSIAEPNTSQATFIKARRKNLGKQSETKNIDTKVKQEPLDLIEDNMETVSIPSDNNRLLEIEFVPCEQIKVEPDNDIVGDTLATPKLMSFNKETMNSVVKQEPLDAEDCPVFPADDKVQTKFAPSVTVKIEPDENIDLEDTVLYKLDTGLQAPNSNTDRNEPKTSAQRKREYRERIKAKKASAAAAAAAAANSNAKTAAQRSKEYRERKKKSGKRDDSTKKRSFNYRHRLKLKQLDHIISSNSSSVNNSASYINENEIPRKQFKSNTAQEEIIQDSNSHDEGKLNTQNLDMPPKSNSVNDQRATYSHYDQHCSAHLDFFNSLKNNTFGHPCAVCDRLWWQRDLRPSSSIHDNILQTILPNYLIGTTVPICSTCKATLDKQKIPILSAYNGFSYPTIPSHLPTLDLVSKRLISAKLPFIQIRRLRHVHKQNGLFGQIINVPLSDNTMVKKLPRNTDNDYCFYVNMKNKLIHKTSHVRELINKRKVKEWIAYLVETPIYTHLNITSDDTFFNIDDDNDDGTECHIDEISEHVPIEESLVAQQQTLIWNEDEMLPITSGKKKSSISVMFEKYAEELSFPTIYCGHFREYKNDFHITPFTQANSELRRTDRRAAEPEHLLYVALKLMRERVKDKLTDALKCVGVNTNTTKEKVQSEDYINNCIETNLECLRCIPNSASYWIDRKKDLFAIMRQKGAPNAFMTLTANETGWNDLLKLLYKLKNNGTEISDEELAEVSYVHKAALVNQDAITCAIYFNGLISCLLHTLQAKKRTPFGRYVVLDYFRRIEFQDRGSPQAHLLLWLDNVPDNLLSNEADVIKMIDLLVSVSASEASGNIKQQTHKHTYSCYRKTDPSTKQLCRFDAPFMPSRQTLVLIPMKDTDEHFNKYKEHYHLIHTNLENIDYTDFNEFYKHNNIECDLHYNNILRAGINKPTLFYKRTPSEKWHIPFNPFVFHHLQSNMHFQIIQDEHACAGYIAEYFSKTNRVISDLKRQVIDIIDQNPEFDFEEVTTKLSIDVLNSVEMSTQEAAWYLLREPMAKSSIVTVYIPTIYPMERQRIWKSMKVHNELDEDYTDRWKENWFESYENRPECLKDVTLAQFVSKYYKNNKGEYAERKEPKVIRYRNYDIADLIDYRREMVLLHIPFRSEYNDVLKGNKFVKLYEVNKDLILQRRRQFESNFDISKTLEICRQLCLDHEDKDNELEVD